MANVQCVYACAGLLLLIQSYISLLFIVRLMDHGSYGGIILFSLQYPQDLPAPFLTQNLLLIFFFPHQ